MWASIPELTPREVGTPLPISAQAAPETYTYDYIIVGGGTAGCVLASRLTEDPNVSVLVIEQGPVADTWLSRVPLLSANIYDKSNLSTKWWSLPLRHADNRYLEIFRGEALGGTSRVNGTLYTRGCPADYNQWKALGNDGWGYKDLEPYFVKSEKTQSHPASRYRGTNGIWKNRNFLYAPYKIIDHVDRAVQKLGIPHVDDINSPDIPAAHTAIMDIVQDEKFYRNSAFLAFLPPELAQERRTRLKICPNTVVCRVELSTDDGSIRATGVHFETANPRKADFRYVAKARREVIVCAGAIGSPHVLMMSGLGPKAHLEEKGVSVVQDMPAVGSYLADHMAVPVAIQVPLEDSLHRLEVNPLYILRELFTYLTGGGGALACPFLPISTFVPTRLLDPNTHALSSAPAAALDAHVPANRPDIEIMHIANNCADAETDKIGVFSLQVTLIRPRSEGSVRLATANPRARPDVDLGYLGDAADYEPLRKGIRVALRVLEEVRKQGYPVLRDLQVPPDKGANDETLDAFIRSHLRTCFHYTSTCRMGNEVRGERPSVVDAEMRVHGVRGLRVCDASVFPEIIGSHTMAPVVAVAEKCADLLKAV